MRRQLVAKVLGQGVVFRQGAVVGRRGCECHVRAEVVGAGFAAGAAAAGDAGLEGDAVADFERGDGIADFGDGAGGFVAEDHGVFEDEAADGAVGPVVYLLRGGLEEGRGEGEETYIAAANAGPVDVDEDVMLGLEFWDWLVFKLDFVRRFEDEGEILVRGSIP